jgi:hypothetical protein
MPPFPQLPDWFHNDKPDSGTSVSIPLSGIWLWWHDRKIKKDLDDIQRHEEFDESNTDQKHDD